MLVPKTRWQVQQTDIQIREKLMSELRISKLAATLLVNRGMATTEAANTFLNIEKQTFHDPFLMNDMKKSVERIHQAIEREEPILVFGDYDADGVTSTTILMTVLRDLGADARYYIPNRFTEGYGPNEQAFKQACDMGIKLIITVDTGIAAVHEAAVAQELGMDLIITDHHEPGPVHPAAFALVHPKLGDAAYPFLELAGAGVAFKLAHALYGKVPEKLLELAAIGTIADLVPLHGENRLIAKLGLKELSRSTRPGLKALCKISGVKLDEVNEDTIGFAIGPRLNAAGRLDHAGPAVELLSTDSDDTAWMLAEELDAMNKERKAIVQEMSEEAIALVEEHFPPNENHVLVIGKEGWNPGVIGIVASRLVERFYRPAIVLSLDKETGLAKGSARSIPGFDMFQNLSACSEILPHFGGHPMAAGMTLNIENIERLRSALHDAAGKQLNKDDFVPITQLDAVVDLAEIDLSSVSELDKLAPYGMNNPKPVVMIEQANTKLIKKIGGNQAHLKMSLEKNGFTLDGVGFHLGHAADGISPSAEVSVIGELAINEWNNMKKPQILIKDVAVRDWQLFDFRSHKPLQQWVDKLTPDRALFILFDEKNGHIRSMLPRSAELRCIQTVEEAELSPLDGRDVVLFDLPPSLSLLDSLVNGKSPARIYLHFHHETEQFFNTMPTREHFKWFYGFLLKRKSFDLRRHGEDLAAFRGWTKETVQFMSEVFFELDFVTMKDGILSINPEKTKKDLSEAPSYQKKQAQLEIESELLFSSFQQVKEWFEARVMTRAGNEEEAIAWT